MEDMLGAENDEGEIEEFPKRKVSSKEPKV